LDGIKLNLGVFEFDTQISVLGVEVVVMVHLASESPVVMGKEGVVQDLEVSSGAHHEEAEPHWNGECRFRFSLLIVLVIGLCIQIDGVGWRAQPVGICIPRHCAIVVELDSFSGGRKPISVGNMEVGNAAIIECVPFWGLLERLLVLEDALLKCLNLLRKVAILDCSIGFMVGDGCEQSICNGAKELSVDVRVHGEGRLGGLW